MRTKLAIMLGILAMLAASLVLMRDAWSLQPFQSKAVYTNISRVAIDEQNAVYSIANSKKEIHKVDQDGMLVYSYSSNEGMAADAVYMFNSIAADSRGAAYALETKLDSFGLKVLGERILQIAPNGSQIKVLYEQEYESSNLYRIGNIQSLMLQQDQLYFFRKENNRKAVLLKLPMDQPGEPEVIDELVLPEGASMKELAWTGDNTFLATSKQGILYYFANGNWTMLYPEQRSGGNAEGLLNFPLSIAPSNNGRVYYIDEHDQAIKSISYSSGKQSTDVISLRQLLDYRSDLKWAKFSHLTVEGNRILAAATDQMILANADGQIEKVLTGYKYPVPVVLKKVLYWFLIAVFAVSLFMTARMIYIDFMKRKLFLLVKQLAVILPIVLISMVGLSYSVYTSFSAEMKADTYKQLKILAANGKYLVDGDSLKLLNSPKDYGNNQYQYIKKRINEVFSLAGEDRSGLYNTIYRYMNGKLYIVMDDDDSTTMFEPFPINEENQLVIERGEIVLGEWEDETGEWMYALGPIYHSNGEIIGIYETGKDMIGVKQSNMNILYDVIKLFALIGIILLVMITILTVYLLSSLRTLRRHVNLIANGEWDVKVDIRSRDEVEELGDRFNMMAGSIHQYIQEVTRLSNSYFRFVPQQFLKVLGKTNMTQIKLGEQQNRRMTIMVCNMRGFNEASAQMSTKQNFQFINSFLKYFGPTIREHGGFTSRYLGPGMLTMFPNGASAAIDAASKLRSKLQQYNMELRAHEEPIDIGIAVHTGDVMLGIIGEEQRMEGSVVSNHVQLSLDLEKVSAKLGVSVLLTESTMQELKAEEAQQVRRLGRLIVDADQEAIELYDWYAGDSELIRKLKHETKQQFEQAVDNFRTGRFYDAREGFVAVVKKNRYDLAAKLYFFECDRFVQGGEAADRHIALRIS
ncbi:HAMP domain-containing protein [Paenibacillus sp. GXUN7292]|uniref:HAMP domain-containing protein n=1 Tax=Paenibacillus sp. GXUN7292 TaxID=3422499 RepID=UPI003D7E27B8